MLDGGLIFSIPCTVVDAGSFAGASAVCSVHSAVCSVHSAVCNVQCAVCQIYEDLVGETGEYFFLPIALVFFFYRPGVAKAVLQTPSSLNN